MMETALVFDLEGNTIFWHEPPGRSSGSLPDSDALWDILWEHRARGGSGRLGGVAHTHPWNGPTGPSGTDLSTFAAVEKGLGQRLVWPIVTFTHVIYLQWSDEHQAYVEIDPFPTLGGLEELRKRSS